MNFYYIRDYTNMVIQVLHLKEVFIPIQNTPPNIYVPHTSQVALSILKRIFGSFNPIILNIK